MRNTDNNIIASTADSKLAHSIDGAAEQLGDSGRTKLFEWIGSGRLRAKKLDGRTIILDEDLRRFIASLPDVPVKAA